MGVWAWGSGKWRTEETAGARHSVPKAPARRRSHLEGWDGVSGVPNAERALPRPHTPRLVFAHSQSALPCPEASKNASLTSKDACPITFKPKTSNGR